MGFIGIFVFIFALFIGSFLKVLADRLPRGESPIGGRSYCENCKHLLGVLDLIPVFSFIFLLGKCRYCKHQLSMSYPLSEIFTAILFVVPVFFLNQQFVYPDFEYLMRLGFYLFVIAGLIVIFLADLKYYLIPFQVLLPSIVVIGIWQYLMRPEEVMSFFVSGACAFIFFSTIFILTKGRGMGFGDVVYSFYMGILLGFPGIVVGLYVAFLTGAVVSVILIIRGRKKLKGGVIPFGPFLVFGTYVALFWGEWLGGIVMRYLNI